MIDDQITGDTCAPEGQLTCMNHATTSVHVIQAQQHLLRDLPNQRHGDPFILVSLYQTEQILAENLEDHVGVNTIRAFMSKVIEEGDDERSAGVSVRRRGRGRGGLGWVGAAKNRGVDEVMRR